MTRKYRKITEAEKQYILQNYKTKYVTEIANNLKRSRTFVKNFFEKNKLKPLEQYPKINGLSAREHQAMTFLAQGYTKTETANKMYVANATLYACLSNIYQKYELDRKQGREILTKALLIWLQRNDKLKDWELKI